MKQGLLLAFAATAIGLTSLQGVRAQDPPSPPPPPTSVSTWYPTEVRHSSDRARPSPPRIECVLVWRGWGDHGALSETSCLAHRAFIQFSVKPGSDNETPVDRLGYHFEYVDGAMPQGLTVFPTAYSLPATGELYLTWDDSVTWNQDEFCFRVAVRAIDQAGNESERSNVLIVGHDGDMDFMHRMADGYYSLAASREATRQAKNYLQRDIATTVDTVRVAAATTRLKPPSVITDVYDNATISGIEHMRVARIDRVALDYPAKAGNIPFELEPYSLAETGRELSKDEILELRDLLLDPHSYIPDHWTCISNPEYALTSGSGRDKAYVVVQKDCLGVAITGPGFRHGGELTREAGSLLRAYCEGLFQLPLLK
jgi:hypothetical protein